MNNLGQKIKEQRIKKGLTQQEFAELLYVSDKTISSYECNRTVPDINMLFKISNILDINLYNLIDNNFNSLDNLVYLCPNHHILFDRGKLSKEDISCIGKLNS